MLKHPHVTKYYPGVEMDFQTGRRNTLRVLTDLHLDPEHPDYNREAHEELHQALTAWAAENGYDEVRVKEEFT